MQIQPAAPPAALATARPAPAAHPSFQRVAVSSIAVQFVAFDSRTHRLELADQAAGPGTRWPDARAAAATRNGLAAINGGFFTPQGAPLGLVIANGTRRGTWNPSSSLTSGCYLESTTTLPALARRTTVNSADPALTTLLQAGPFLVEHGHAITGLEADRSRPRSILAWDGTHRWFFAVTSPCSLAELARALAAAAPAGWPIRHALNLDGGRSSELWVADQLPGGPVTHRPPFNKPVRNFLVLTPR
jgi:hypothetical protein